MRLLLILAALAVFGAMLLFDTAALIRLTLLCAGGGCGVRPLWIGLGTAAIALTVLVVAHRQTRRSAGRATRRPAKRTGKPEAAPKAPQQRRAKAPTARKGGATRSPRRPRA